MAARARSVAFSSAILLAMSAGCLDLPSHRPFGIAVGWLGAVRTELGPASGWAVDVSFPTKKGDPYAAVIGATQHDNDGEPTTVWRGAYGFRLAMPVSFVIYDLSWAGHVDDRDGWGTGPRFGCGVGVFRDRFDVYALPSAYVWLGGKDGTFDIGIEGEIRLAIGVRF